MPLRIISLIGIDPVTIDALEILQNNAKIDIEKQHPEHPLIQLDEITEYNKFDFLVLVVVTFIKLYIIFVYFF